AASSANRQRVHQAAVLPLRVQAAFDLQRAGAAQVAIEAFSVVADLLDDVVGPGVVDSHALARARRDAQDALHGGTGALAHLVDVSRSDAVLLGFQHGVQRPLHDVQPAVITLADHGPQGLLGNDLGQDDVVVRLGKA